jgi:hypothetical protein
MPLIDRLSAVPNKRPKSNLNVYVVSAFVMGRGRIALYPSFVGFKPLEASCELAIGAKKSLRCSRPGFRRVGSFI